MPRVRPRLPACGRLAEDRHTDKRRSALRRRLASSIACFTLLLTPLSGATSAYAAESQRSGDTQHAEVRAKTEIILLPEPGASLYAPYIADPRRPNFSLQLMTFSASDIPDSGEHRYGIKMGGLIELVEARSKDGSDRGWQLELEAGFIGQSDRTQSEDFIGWDGIYGLLASWRPSDALAYRVGLHHVSAHVGDEYAERTGRQRINYTRGELVAGVRASPGGRWHTYAEAGWAYDLRNEALQRPWRAQLGLEYIAPWRASAEWYAAADVYASEERDWRIDRTLQVGIALRRGARTWRFGIEHYRGRSLLGEFFQNDERYTSLAVWLDL